MCGEPPHHWVFLKAKDLRRESNPILTTFSTAVAVGDYQLTCMRTGTEGFLDPGWMNPMISQPMDCLGIRSLSNPFECFIPQDIDGFLPAEESRTRLANGATRLQPSTMLTGQAAGAIAGAAVQYSTARDVEPLIVQEILLEAGRSHHHMR